MPSISDILNPRVTDYASPDVFLPSQTGNDVFDLTSIPAPMTKPAVPTSLPITPPTSFGTTFGTSPESLFRNLLSAYNAGGVQFDSTLSQLGVPRTFSLPFGAKTLTLSRNGGNVSIIFGDQTVAVVPLALMIGGYIVYVIVWLLLTKNASWSLPSRLIGALPLGVPVPAAGIGLATLFEWLVSRGGFKNLMDVWTSKKEPIKQRVLHKTTQDLVDMFVKMLPKGLASPLMAKTRIG